MSIQRKLALSCIFILLLGLFLTCDSPDNPFRGNPFTNNLGDKVTVEPPTITINSPLPGAYLKGSDVRFTGRATAYRELSGVEVKIYNYDDRDPPLLNWTKKGITLVGDRKNKSWTYSLDTLPQGFPPDGLNDGLVTIQFRAIDVVNKITESVKLIYIVKNKPSVVRMISPPQAQLDNVLNGGGIADSNNSYLVKGTELTGRIVDTRGIKPGYPRIKIWAADDPAGEPDDTQWGMLFLSGIDNTTGPAEDWSYADRSSRRVDRSANFRFKLSKFNIVNNRIVYNQVGDPDYGELDAGKVWRFRIMTYETYFIDQPGANFELPRPAVPPDEEELVGWYPSLGPADNAPFTSGPYYEVFIKPTGVPPTITLDNTDKGPADLEVPNIYITDRTSYKILLDDNPAGTFRPSFRLRIKVEHESENIGSVDVEWSHLQNGSGTLLPVTAVPGTSSVYFGEFFPTAGDNFVSSSQPYTLTVTAITTGGTRETETYSIYLSNDGPKVDIREIKGTATEPTPTDDFYTVNGNILVSVDYSAAMGIKTEDGNQMVKWVVVTDPPTTMENYLNTYKLNPSALNLDFFNDLTASLPALENADSGWVDAAGGTRSFRLNTVRLNNYTDYWLYIIAQDMNQQLGYTKVKLKVDQSSDNPKPDAPGLTSTTEGIGTVDRLFIEINNNQIQQYPSDTRRNVLDKDTGITLSFKDDDSFNLNNLTITITDLNTGTAQTLSLAQIQSILTAQGQSISNLSSKEWAGMLSQPVMAAAMNNNDSKPYLRDGLYKLEIACTDDPGAKVDINGVNISPTPGGKDYFFCVINEQPKITITSPERNGFVTSSSETVYGTISSYIPVQKLWISFDPGLTGQNPAPGDQFIVIDLYKDAAYTQPNAWRTDPAGPGGEYTYYWRRQNVDFTDPITTTEELSFTLKAADNLGYFVEESSFVKVDGVPPTVELDEFYFSRPMEVDPVTNMETHRVNGKFNFIISAQDNNGIKWSKQGETINGATQTQDDLYAYVKWWILPDSYGPPSGATPSAQWDYNPPGAGLSGWFPNAADQGGGRFAAIINSGTVNASYNRLPDGTYTLYAMARDRADNYSLDTSSNPGPRELITFIIDQNADYPVMDDDELSPNGDYVIRTRTGLKITGRVTDDDSFTGSTGSTVQIRFRTTPANTTWSNNWQSTAVTVDPFGGLTFEYVIDNTTDQDIFDYFAVDGPKQYQIRVSDVQINKNPTLTGVIIENDAVIQAVTQQLPGSTASDYYRFILKNNPPAIHFAQNDNVSIKTRAELLSYLAGGRVDDQYLDSVTVSFNRDAGYPPVELLNQTALGQPAYNYGTNTQFFWNLGHSSLLALSPRSWLPSTADFDSGTYPDGMYSIVITARDMAGNIATKDWRFNKDTQGPKITFNNVDNDLRNAPTPATNWPAKSVVSVISGDQGTLAITGRFDDEYSNINSAEYQFDGGQWEVLNIPNVNSPYAKSKNWSIVIPATVSDGLHYFTIKAKDELGNEGYPDTTPPAIGGNGSVSIYRWVVIDRNNPLVTPTDDMLVGPASLWPNDLPPQPKPVPEEEARIFGAFNPSIINPTSATVVYTLSGTVSDVNLSNITFAIRPVSRTTTPVTTYSLASILPEWSVGVGPFQSTDAEQRLTVTSNATTNTWDWTLNILGKDIDALKTALGSQNKGAPCFITISAEDLAGRSSDARDWRFYLDSDAVEITPSNFNDTSISPSPPVPTVFENSGDVTLMGTAEDDKRVKSIEFYISKWNYAANSYAGEWEYASPAGWSAANTPVWRPMNIPANPGALVTWSLTGADLPSAVYGTGNIFLDDGKYRISLKASDWSLGAAGAAASPVKDIVFFIDRKDPVVNWDPVNKDKMFFRKKQSVPNPIEDIKFTASDLNSVPTVTVTIASAALGVNRQLSASEIDLSGPISGNAAMNYTRDVILRPEGLADGRYTLTLTVKDSSGRTETLYRDITIDNTVPVIEINGIVGTNNGHTTTITTPVTQDGNKDGSNHIVAITGRQEFRGIFTKATGTSPVAFVAFYVAPAGANQPAVITPPLSPGYDPDHGSYAWLVNRDNDLNVMGAVGSADRTALYNAGWRFYEENITRNELRNGTNAVTGAAGSGPVLMRIEDGLTNVNMRIPNASLLTMSSPTVYTGGSTQNTSIWFNGQPLTSSDDINKLQIYILAVDEAGNRNISVYDYWVYPEGDRPTVTITSPDQNQPEDTRLINGRFRIGGMAKDNFRIKTVWFRILDMEPGANNGNPITNRVQIPEWNGAGEPIQGSYQSAVNLTRNGIIYGPGWFKASGGGKAEVPWYAYINGNGELDPLLAGSRKIRIEAVAEDYQYDQFGEVDLSPTAEGLTTRTAKFVNATVVKGAPVFGNEYIKRSASGLTTLNDIPSLIFDGSWVEVLYANLRGRAAYSVTITHDAGLKEITWTPPGQNPVNLLNGMYADYGTNLNGMDQPIPAGTGIAVRAGPKKVFTGTGQNLTGGKRYLIWKWDRASAPVGLTNLIADYSTFPITTDMRFITVTPTASATLNLGSNELMEANGDDKFEWMVVIDIHADLINNGAYKYGNGSGPWSGRFPVNLRATENSQSVPLYTDYRAELPIDNQPPQALYTHNAYIVGTAATIGGEAGDSGPVSGLDRVVLWFTRNGSAISGGSPVSWHELSGTGAGGDGVGAKTFAGGGAVPQGLSGFGAGPTSPNIPFDYAENDPDGTNYSSIVMKYHDPLGQNAKFGHKLPIGFATVGGEFDTAWYATINSLYIQSGRITANYIVFDKAGNASYYSQRLVVMNGVPRITRITLGTDIRGDKGLTGTSGSFPSNGSYGFNRNDGRPNVAAPLATIRNKFTDGTDIQRGISDYISIDTDTARDYGAVYDEAFNVRNNLLAIQVEVPQNKGDGNKDRTFRVEYVSGAEHLTDAAAADNGNTFYRNMKAGRIYMINNPGSRFPWGSLGVRGENPRRGLAFMAVEDGPELNVPNQDYRLNGVAPSVWELNSYYYNNPSNSLDRNRVPTDLILDDVGYDAVSDPTDGKSAEFVYGANAFDHAQFAANEATTMASKIHDFNPINTSLDGRPVAYPDSNTRNPWELRSLFIVRVFGGTEDELFGDFVLLSIRVNNDDRTRPYAQLYDLNPKTEGQDNAQTQAQALGISRIGDNRVKGGLYNTGTVQKVAKSGHIEPRRTTTLTSAQMGGAASASQATITKPYLAEADKAAKLFAVDTVSGDVILRGYVEDDQRIAEVTLNFNCTDVNADGSPIGGTNVPILQRSSGFDLQVVPAENGRVAFYETVDLYRHRVEWAYLWRTESVPGGNNVVATGMNVYAISRNADASLAAKTRSFPVTLSAANADYNYFNPDYAAAMPRYNWIPVNLRPYITGFRRNESTFAHHTRSRQGWYMFARNEIAVVTGFNLLNGNNTTNSIINLQGMGNFTTENVGTPGNFGITGTNNTRYRQFTVGANAVTGNGLITLTVNNYAAVNTRPATVPSNETADSLRALAAGTPVRPLSIQAWNIERSPGTAGSELWDDFTQTHIWQSNDTAPGGTEPGRFASTNNWVILSPAMSIDPRDGTLYESHNESGSGRLGNSGTTRRTPITTATASSGANTSTNDVVTQFVDPVFFSDVYYSPGRNGVAAAAWTVSSIIGRNSTLQGWRALGGIYINGPGGGSIMFAGGGNSGTVSQEANTFTSSLYHGESTWYNASNRSSGSYNPPTTDQFMNPHIVTFIPPTGTALEHIHVSYYDDKDNSLKYRYNLRSTPGSLDPGSLLQTSTTDWAAGTQQSNDFVTNANAIPKMWTNLDGGVDAEDTAATNYTSEEVQRLATGTNNTGTLLGQNLRVVRNGNRGDIKAGKHNSIAVTSQGYPVIAYYDETNQRLKLAVSRSVAPVLASNWVIRDFVIPESDLSSFGTGAFVSMKINTVAGSGPNQELNRVHIAAMNTAKRLVYVTGILNPDAGTGNTQQESEGVLTDVKVQVVDSVGNVGRWCSLSLDSAGNPWISYMDESYVGARDGAKVAFLNTTTFYKGVAGGYFPNGYIDRYGESLGGWETMHVPTLHRVENPVEGPGREHGRLGMECFPARNVTSTNNRIWSAAVGYLSQDAEGAGQAMDRYRLAYYVK